MTPALAAALRLPVLPVDESTRLLAAAQAGDRTARDTVILHSLRLVTLRMRIWCAWLDRVTGDRAFEDTLLEGVEGLCEAIEHYDASRGAWTSCAVWWIDDRLRDFAWDEISVVKVPGNRRKSAHHRELKQLFHPVRLDGVVSGYAGDTTGTTRLDMAPAPPDVPDELQAQTAAAAAVADLLRRLESDEQRWLCQRRFIDLATLDEIGRELGVSGEAVRLRLLRVTKKMLRLAKSPLTVKQFTTLWTQSVEMHKPRQRRGGAAPQESLGAQVIPFRRRVPGVEQPRAAVV